MSSGNGKPKGCGCLFWLVCIVGLGISAIVYYSPPPESPFANLAVRFLDFGTNGNVVYQLCAERAPCSLAIFNVDSGKSRLFIPPEGEEWMMPKFSSDGKNLVFSVAREDQDMQLAILDIGRNTYEGYELGPGNRYVPCPSDDLGKIVYFKEVYEGEYPEEGPYRHYDLFEMDVELKREVRLTEFEFSNWTSCAYVRDQIIYSAAYPNAMWPYSSTRSNFSDQEMRCIAYWDENRVFNDSLVYKLYRSKEDLLKDENSLVAGTPCDGVLGAIPIAMLKFGWFSSVSSSTKDGRIVIKSQDKSYGTYNAYIFDGNKIEQITHYTSDDRTSVLDASISKEGDRYVLDLTKNPGSSKIVIFDDNDMQNSKRNFDDYKRIILIEINENDERIVSVPIKWSKFDIIQPLKTR